jgi:RHS repeat-associated protein
VDNGSDVITYRVDGMGRRIAKLKNGVEMTRWTYLSALNVASELDVPTGRMKTFVYASRGNVPDLMVVREGSVVTTYRFATDHLGSVRMVVNAACPQTVPSADVYETCVVWHADYDEYGRRELVKGDEGLHSFGFAGGLFDHETGLTRFGARDYDAQVGRWTARDPILFGGGQANLYEYCASDPVNRIDPSGLDWMEDTADWLDDNGIDDFAAGMGDALTGIPFTDMSLTGLARDASGSNESVNTCSGAYLGGQIAGTALATAIHARGYATGHEFTFGKNLRIAPWGNRTGHPTGKFPHYHRRATDGAGQTKPGGSIKRHRPWDSRETDTSLGDRF